MSTPSVSQEPTDRSPEPSTAPELSIGPRLASHRARRGMRVSALAREIGVSASLISQIERGQSRPSVSTLFAIAQALDIPVDALFRDAGEPDSDGREPEERAAPPTASADRHLVRRGERAAIAIEGGVRWERLTPRQLADIEFMELVYSPGAESHASRYRHPGLEMVMVLEGSLNIDVAFERYELGVGDSLCFPSTTPHRYFNPTDETSRAVTVILPDAGSTGPPTTNHRRP